MYFKTMKFLLATTAVVAVGSHVAKKVFKYFSKEPCSKEDSPQEIIEEANLKNREINDVILFSDDNIHHTFKVSPTKNISICESRELNCYKLISYIKAARETLDVCMYLITSEEITQHIIKLGQKHILVRIVVDSDTAYTPPSQVKKLQEFSFIQVQTNKKSILMHHKFCIIDGPKAIKRKAKLKAYAENLNIYTQLSGIKTQSNMRQRPPKAFVMSGSLNWSTQAMITNYENIIVTSNSSIVNKFETEFDCLWDETEPVSSVTKRIGN